MPSPSTSEWESTLLDPERTAPDSVVAGGLKSMGEEVANVPVPPRRVSVVPPGPGSTSALDKESSLFAATAGEPMPPADGFPVEGNRSAGSWMAETTAAGSQASTSVKDISLFASVKVQDPPGAVDTSGSIKLGDAVAAEVKLWPTLSGAAAVSENTSGGLEWMTATTTTGSSVALEGRDFEAQARARVAVLMPAEVGEQLMGMGVGPAFDRTTFVNDKGSTPPGSTPVHIETSNPPRCLRHDPLSGLPPHRRRRPLDRSIAHHRPIPHQVLAIFTNLSRFPPCGLTCIQSTLNLVLPTVPSAPNALRVCQAVGSLFFAAGTSPVIKQFALCLARDPVCVEVGNTVIQDLGELIESCGSLASPGMGAETGVASTVDAPATSRSTVETASVSTTTSATRTTAVAITSASDTPVASLSTTTATVSPASTPDTPGPPIALIAGISVGGLVLLAGIVGVTAFLRRQRVLKSNIPPRPAPFVLPPMSSGASGTRVVGHGTVHVVNPAASGLTGWGWQDNNQTSGWANMEPMPPVDKNGNMQARAWTAVEPMPPASAWRGVVEPTPPRGV
ncbi:hypothetical protein HDU96_004476 [Phlyctochytrium bullatum]|nr:hypothetical protein HDU96_004476 [Phlyctochytrium bullatum]